MKNTIYLLITMTFFSAMLISCCGKKTQKNDQPVIQVQEQAQVEEKVKMQELEIANPDYEDGIIYGKLFRPEREGKFPLIILSHGYNAACGDFDGDSEFFARNGFASFAYDFAGGSSRSKSTGKTSEMTLLTEKSNLITVLEYLIRQDFVDSDKVVLLGASQGGLVSALVADEFPSKIKALELFYPAFCIPDDWRRTFPEGSPIPEGKNFWGLDLGKEFFEVARAMHVEEVTGKFSGPVLILHGDNDQVVPYQSVWDAKKRYSDARLELFANEGHGFSYQGAVRARQMVVDHAKKALGL